MQIERHMSEQSSEEWTVEEKASHDQSLKNMVK